jgi:hypothetical protein
VGDGHGADHLSEPSRPGGVVGRLPVFTGAGTPGPVARPAAPRRDCQVPSGTATLLVGFRRIRWMLPVQTAVFVQPKPSQSTSASSSPCPMQALNPEPTLEAIQLRMGTSYAQCVRRESLHA